jgi:hypothetical protein
MRTDDSTRSEPVMPGLGRPSLHIRRVTAPFLPVLRDFGNPQRISQKGYARPKELAIHNGHCCAQQKYRFSSGARACRSLSQSMTVSVALGDHEMAW